MLSSLDHLDVLERAGKTFVQAFFAAWALSGNALTKDALIGALAAAISAVINYGLQLG